MHGSQLNKRMAVSWYNQWWSAGSMSGGQLVQRVAVSWFNEWQSAVLTCGE